MLKLKKYQERSIHEFDEFLDYTIKLSSSIPNCYQVAFNACTNEQYKNIIDLDVPFICIKIPTAGGKTLVATHMLNSLYIKFLQNKKNSKGLVVWSVPSTAILSQTLSNLKNPNHPYREVLNKNFSNSVKIFDFKEMRHIKKSDLENNLCIFVTTFGAVRITDKDKRKAYQDSGELLEHFKDIDEDFLDKDKDNNIIYSLMNVIKLANPILIIDEGHNTKTKLSYEMIQDLNPSFVLEYTATPIPDKSNVLVNVTTEELKAENMVKVPIKLHTIAKWQQTIRDGIEWRNKLEKIAKKEEKETKEYIRPIALIQAESDVGKKNTVHIEKILDFLKKDQKIPESQIAIKISKIDEISGVNLYAKDCDIRYILTINALKEGWDNNFPYILISVANIGSKISVEQTIGRILRLPNNKLKKHPELNESYVFTSHQRFREAAAQLVKGLENYGYSIKDIKEFKSKTINEEIYPQQIKDKDIKIPYISVIEA